MKWSDITIEKYQRILAVTNTELPNFNKEMELVGYLFGIPNNELLNMPIEKFKHYTKQLEFLNNFYEGEMQKEFTINGIKYCVHWEMQKRTAGQFVDLSELTKDADLINDNLHLILAVICLPENEPYNSEKILQRAQVFKQHLTMDIVYPIAGFFLTVLQSSLPVIQDYLNKDIQKNQRELLEMIKDSMSIGDGMPHLTN